MRAARWLAVLGALACVALGWYLGSAAPWMLASARDGQRWSSGASGAGLDAKARLDSASSPRDGSRMEPLPGDRASAMVPMVPAEGASQAARAAASPLAHSPALRPTARRGPLLVVALVEGSFRAAEPAWESVIASRLAEAADLLRDAAGLELRAAGAPVAWVPGTPWSGLEDLLMAAARDAEPVLAATGADLAVGFARRPGPLASGDYCGLAPVFENSCVVMDLGAEGIPEALYRSTIAHEIAHCFGCFHVDDPKSIMVHVPSESVPRAFDEANREVLWLTREMDPACGEESLSEAALVRIAELARDHASAGDVNTGAVGLSRRAYRVLLDEDFTEGARLCQLALRYAPELARARYNLSYALYRLGRTEEARGELARTVADEPALSSEPQVRDLLAALGAATTR